MLSSIAEFLLSAKGRISRSQFWLKWVLPLVGFELVWLAIFIAIAIVAGFTDQAIILGFPMWYFLGFVITAWPFTAVLVKRIHDRNKPGWIVLAYWIPMAIGIYVPFYNLFQATGPHDTTALVTISADGARRDGLVLHRVWLYARHVGPDRYGPDPDDITEQPRTVALAVIFLYISLGMEIAGGRTSGCHHAGVQNDLYHDLSPFLCGFAVHQFCPLRPCNPKNFRRTELGAHCHAYNLHRHPFLEHRIAPSAYPSLH